VIRSLEVSVADRRFRVILRNGEAVAVDMWVVKQFGPYAPHAYWRRVWVAGRRAPGPLVRAAIAEAMAAAEAQVAD
jgi:hypothetical protein